MIGSTNLNTVVMPSGLSGLMPPRHVGRRIGMPSTVKRPFSPRGLQALPVSSSQMAAPPRGALSSLTPHFASGGQADFETIALDAARHGHAGEAINDYLSSRMSQGGEAKQSDLMKQVGDLLHRVHRVWHQNMFRGGAVGYAQGGQADGGSPDALQGDRALMAQLGLMPKRSQLSRRQSHRPEPYEPIFKRQASDALSEMDPSDYAQWLWARGGGMLPGALAGGVTAALYSPDAGAQDESWRYPGGVLR